MKKGNVLFLVGKNKKKTEGHGMGKI